jgi:hypothetical protein
VGVTVKMTEAERIAVLETKFEAMEQTLEKISAKLDTLLELKSKGMGAVWLVGILLSSGLAGVIMLVTNAFKGSHLG